VGPLSPSATRSGVYRASTEWILVVMAPGVAPERGFEVRGVIQDLVVIVDGA
jgi:hypothetical protein